MNKYRTFQHEFTARHTDNTSDSAVSLQIIVFCTLMFIAGFAFGYYISAAEAAHAVSTATK